MKYIPLMRHNISPPAQSFTERKATTFLFVLFIYFFFCGGSYSRWWIDGRPVTTRTHIVGNNSSSFRVMLFNAVLLPPFILLWHEEKIRLPSTTTTTATNRKRTEKETKKKKKLANFQRQQVTKKCDWLRSGTMFMFCYSVQTTRGEKENWSMSWVLTFTFPFDSPTEFSPATYAVTTNHNL